MTRRTSRAAWLCAAAVGSTAFVLPASPALAQAACDDPVASTTQTGYTVADPDCEFSTATGIGAPFAALPGATALTGIDDGQAWRIEVPDNWNGDLVVWAHGYRGEGTTVFVDSPALRPHLIAQGYAWAASSYQTNSYDVQQGVDDSHAMIARFTSEVEGAADQLDQVIIHGASMGGHVTAVTLEQHPESWDAGYPVCGVLGDTALFDFFLGANATAAALAGAPDIPYPTDPATYGPIVNEQIVPELFTVRPTQPTQAGLAWAGALQQLSGGERPGFASAFGFWNAFGRAPLPDAPFLFGVYPGLSALATVAGNADAVYQLDADPALSEAEQALNDDVLRNTADPNQQLVPVVEGNPQVPVLSLHTLGDLFVPFSMEQIYADETETNEAPFVSRAIRGTGHCDFTAGELVKGFDDLVRWVATGFQPAGDPILDPEAVASPTFGCRFTVGAHANFTAATACPTFPDIAGSVHQAAVESLLAGGVVRGLADGSFGPARSIDRGQVASLVVRALGLEPLDGGATFTDTTGSAHEEAIRALADAGIALGYPDGTFRPLQPVSRAQLASLVARALDVPSTTTACFDDVAGGAHAGTICALAELDVLNGFADGTFGPSRPISRAQTASVVWRAFG